MRPPHERLRFCSSQPRAEIGRNSEEIERSCGANPRKPETGDAYLEAGASLLTLGFDGRDNYDLSPLAEWVAWRDQVNAA